MTTQDYEDRSGWLTFSAIVLFSVAFVRIISAFSYFDDSQEIADLSRGLFGDSLWAWGVWDLCIAAVALFAGWSLLTNGPFGRVMGYIWAVLVIVQGFLILNQAPWFGAAAITLAVLVLHGLTSTRERG